VAQQNIVRDINQLNALLMLRRGRSYSRAQIARVLKLTRSTVSAIAADLIQQGLVVEVGTTAVGDRGGRPGAKLALNPRGASFLGAEFSDDHITVLGLALEGTEVVRSRQDFKPGESLEWIIAQLARMVVQVRAENEADLPSLQGLGISVPGMLHGDGHVSWLPGLHWQEFDIAGYLEQKLGIPVIIENDANASAMAELLFGREDVPGDFLYLLLDSGVGSGIVVDRSLYRGADGSSGEVGHMRLDPTGPRCGHCGGSGCFETMVNADALVRYFRRAGGSDATAEQVAGFAREGNEAAAIALDRWTWWLSRGLANLIYVLNPGQVILGGAFAGLLPDLSEELSTRLKADGLLQTIDIRASSFGEAGGAVGAAALVYQRMFRTRPLTDSDVLHRMERGMSHPAP
jgi:predicted NBD/HSP70 family sugar kinase